MFKNPPVGKLCSSTALICGWALLCCVPCLCIQAWPVFRSPIKNESFSASWSYNQALNAEAAQEWLEFIIVLHGAPSSAPISDMRLVAAGSGEHPRNDGSSSDKDVVSTKVVTIVQCYSEEMSIVQLHEHKKHCRITHSLQCTANTMPIPLFYTITNSHSQKPHH